MALLRPRDAAAAARLARRADLAAVARGWRLVSVVGTQTYYFPGGYALAPGATVRVHTGPDAWGNGGSDLKWTTAYIWNNDGDKAELRDAAGQVVSSQCYGTGCP